jgi:cold shock CspA family protein
LAREQALATQNPLKRETLRKSALQQVASLTMSDAKSAYGFHTAAMVRLDEMREILEADGENEGGSERMIVELSRDIERSLNAGLQKFPDDVHLLAAEAAYRELIQEHWIAARLAARYVQEGDANYDARFWYARELFLGARFDEAHRLFSALKHAPVSPSGRNLVRGIVQDGSEKAKKYSGVVVKKEETYVFVHADELQRDVFGHSSTTSESTWTRLRRGTRVSFELGFNMRGPAISSIMIEEPE